MKLAILGATGTTGQHVLEKALASDHDVTVLVRDAGKVKQKSPKLTVLVGSVTSADDVAKAIHGCDAVISTLGPRENKDPICPTAAEALVQAMKREGVKRVVWTSAAGVGDSAGPTTKASFVF